MLIYLHKRIGHQLPKMHEKESAVLVETTQVRMVTPINTGGSVIHWGAPGQLNAGTLDVWESVDQIWSAQADLVYTVKKENN